MSIREGRAALEIRVGYIGTATENWLEKRTTGKETGKTVRSVGATRDTVRQRRMRRGTIGQRDNGDNEGGTEGTRAEVTR